MRSVGSLGGWVEGGSKGAGRQHTRILHIHTHERSMHACVPHSLHNSPHILYEMQMRLYEILRDSAPVRGGSAVGNRRFGSTNHPRNAPLFFDNLYFPNCISIFHAMFPKKSVFVNKQFLEFIVKGDLCKFNWKIGLLVHQMAFYTFLFDWDKRSPLKCPDRGLEMFMQ